MMVRYRMLRENDIISMGDEGLRSDCENWSPITENDIVLGLQYTPGFHAPMRRPLVEDFPLPFLKGVGEVSLRTLLEKAQSFRVDHDLIVETRGEAGWVVTRPGSRSMVNTDLEMECEPLPSNSDGEFIARTHFSLEKAFRLAARYITDQKQKGLYHGT